jgi:hypothetical protein
MLTRLLFRFLRTACAHYFNFPNLFIAIIS